jgi:purine-nucleoside phosphorylase
MGTPHIDAEPGDFADLVLLPGDPLRARWIAESFLSDVRQVTDVRNMLGFTGTHRGTPVSVMGTGMGIPSISIYASELIDVYGVRRLVRVGSCGSLQPSVGVREVVIALGASTDSGTNRRRFDGCDFAAIADWHLLEAVTRALPLAGTTVHVGNVLSSDLFYGPLDGRPHLEQFAAAQRMGILAVEMEAAGLYGVAAERGAAALAVCTVSDSLVAAEHLSAEDRERSLGTMVELVLEALT